MQFGWLFHIVNRLRGASGSLGWQKNVATNEIQNNKSESCDDERSASKKRRLKDWYWLPAKGRTSPNGRVH